MDENSSSALDASQYTYYSESVNQSMIDNEMNENAAAAGDVKNIKADLEALEEEQKAQAMVPKLATS